MWPQGAALTPHLKSMESQCWEGGEAGTLAHGQREGSLIRVPGAS